MLGPAFGVGVRDRNRTAGAEWRRISGRGESHVTLICDRLLGCRRLRCHNRTDAYRPVRWTRRPNVRGPGIGRPTPHRRARADSRLTRKSVAQYMDGRILA